MPRLDSLANQHSLIVEPEVPPHTWTDLLPASVRSEIETIDSVDPLGLELESLDLRYPCLVERVGMPGTGGLFASGHGSLDGTDVFDELSLREDAVR